jgi:hypothetical protein
MTRYYYTGNVRYAREGNTTIAEILRSLHVLFVDKKRKHHLVNAAGEAECRRYGWTWDGEHPFVFETPEHEREFLDFHPDAEYLRTTYNRYLGYNVLVKIEVIDYEELPIYRKGNRWFWKK